MWDDEYAVDEYVYGKEPNDFLRDNTAWLQKGNVLCLAEGEGRNAVHLARNGFSVTAVDSSTVGLKKASKLAQEFGVDIDIVHADLADFVIEECVWDSIVSISCHLPSDLRRKVHQGVVAGLREGGTFLLEAYTPRQLKFGTGGPPSPDFTMELTALRTELAGLEFSHGKELVRDVFEGTNHTGQGAVVQVLASKPHQRRDIADKRD